MVPPSTSEGPPSEAAPERGRRKGRRARALTAEETQELAALEEQAQRTHGTEADPGLPPMQRPAGEQPVSGDTPAPSMRRLGKRARVVEGDEQAGGAGTARSASAARDTDGVELGEMSEGERPDPRPAPRFEGSVLHRPERSGARPVVWIIWALIAVALIVLLLLLLLGVIGPGAFGDSTAALAATPTVGAGSPPHLVL